MDDKSRRAKDAMLRRSRDKVKPSNMNQYYAVIGFFIACMFGALVYTLMNPTKSFASMPVIDESAMLIHNGQSHRFTQSGNAFFEDWTISETKKLFEVGLSDNPNIEACRSSQNEDLIIPESFDFRDENPECTQDVPQVNRNCSASYIHSTLSAAQDRICKNGSREPVVLSAQELIDCDKNSDCLKGTVNKVLTWGKRRGFLPESCYPSTGEQGECPEDHIEDNECRQSNNFYKVIDFCIAAETDGIKKEIMMNGPVLAQLSPFTDMLTYSEGVYARTQDSFKFPGQHLFKILGWEASPDGESYWIVENQWGPDWGDQGYAKIASNGETTLDFYALGFAMYPKTMAEAYMEQQQANIQMQEMDSGFGDDLDMDVDQFFGDEEIIDEEL